MNVIKTLEDKLICKDKKELDKLMLDTVILYHSYIFTYGDIDKLQSWRKNEREFYKNRYKLTDIDIINNINTVRNIRDELQKKRNKKHKKLIEYLSYDY